MLELDGVKCWLTSCDLVELRDVLRPMGAKKHVVESTVACTRRKYILHWKSIKPLDAICEVWIRSPGGAKEARVTTYHMNSKVPASQRVTMRKRDDSKDLYMGSPFSTTGSMGSIWLKVSPTRTKQDLKFMFHFQYSNAPSVQEDSSSDDARLMDSDMESNSSPTSANIPLSTLRDQPPPSSSSNISEPYHSNDTPRVQGGKLLKYVGYLSDGSEVHRKTATPSPKSYLGKRTVATPTSTKRGRLATATASSGTGKTTASQSKQEQAGNDEDESATGSDMEAKIKAKWAELARLKKQEGEETLARIQEEVDRIRARMGKSPKK